MANVGDQVQIRIGARDLTNNRPASTPGFMYNDGGPLYATVSKIVENWNTGGAYGRPATVTKVVCVNNGVVVWQVLPEDLVNVISANPAPETPAEPEPTPPEPEAPPQPIPPLASPRYGEKEWHNFDLGTSNSPYAPERDSANWGSGVPSDGKLIETGPGVYDTNGVPQMSNSMFAGTAEMQTPYYEEIPMSDIWPDNREGTMPNSMKQLGRIYRARYKTSWESEGRRREMLNQDASIIQNGEGYPYHVGPGATGEPDVYDYQIIPGDKRYPRMVTLEDKLMKARADLGIQVHGNNDIARSVKFYMYNRYKVPDTNLAHNKTFTHIFFTRPDLYIMESINKPAPQVNTHTDTALLWRRNPELFKLLTDYRVCGDDNNFNMLLSNQITSLSTTDEELSIINSSSSWAEHKMAYGEQYTGRTAGQIQCGFAETSEFSVINLIKLWMTYIDNVSRGAWSPYYGPAGEDDDESDRSMRSDRAHVATRTLDYGASIYLFKCGPDGEDILYWTKYYGVFPISSGASALGWEANGSSSLEGPRLSITFAYSFKRDMSPISLLEFNSVANVQDKATWLPAHDTSDNKEKTLYTNRPFVGAPYIEFFLGNTDMESNDGRRAKSRSEIRLKFREDTSKSRTDDILYRAGGKGGGM